MVVVLFYSDSSVQMSTMEKSAQGNSVLSHGVWPEIIQCVWSVKKGPGQKVLRGCMTHPLGWENNLVPVPLTVEHLRRGSSHTVRRCRRSSMGFLSHIHTPGYCVSSDAPSGIQKARAIIETRVPAVKMQNDGGNTVQSSIWSRLTVLYRKGKYLLLFAGHKTEVIKPGISTKGPIVIKYYEIPLFVLPVYRSSPWMLQSCPLILLFKCSS